MKHIHLPAALSLSLLIVLVTSPTALAAPGPTDPPNSSPSALPPTSAQPLAPSQDPTTSPTAPDQAPAEEDADRNCYRGEFCVYKNANWAISAPGDLMFRTTAASWRWWWDFSFMNDQDSSWANKWTVPVGVYADANHGGAMTVCRIANSQLGYSAFANDRGSSHIRVGGCG